MNQKAQIATVAAVLLGIFLVVITAIKFDWVGKVARGEKIIKFGTEEKVPSSTNDSNESENMNNTDEDSNITTDLLEMNCHREVFENNLTTVSNLTVTFNNKKISKLIETVNISYAVQEGKSVFDTTVKNYNDMSTKYNDINGITISTTPGTNQFEYIRGIYYDTVDETELTAKGLPALTPGKEATMDELYNLYTSEGYNCSQH